MLSGFESGGSGLYIFLILNFNKTFNFFNNIWNIDSKASSCIIIVASMEACKHKLCYIWENHNQKLRPIACNVLKYFIGLLQKCTTHY